MSKRKDDRKKSEQPGVSRRVFLKAFGIFTLVWTSIVPGRLLSAEDVPSEPDNLDEPTAWQEGDPEPMEMKVPGVEPEQQSEEDPPSQPMDDDRGDPPGPDHKWVHGYWWWTNGEYVWVPGYWAIPPEPDYEYEPAYWKHGSNPWIFVRGGWVVAGTTVIVASASPRPVLTAFVITAPRRIRRRNRYWRHYPNRRRRYTPRPYPKPKPKLGANPGTKPKAKSSSSPGTKPKQKSSSSPGTKPKQKPGKK